MTLLTWVPTIGVLCGIAGLYISAQQYREKRLPRHSRTTRKLRNRIRTLDADAELLAEQCPTSLKRDQERARRALAAIHAVTLSDNEFRVMLQSGCVALVLTVIGPMTAALAPWNWLARTIVVVFTALAASWLLPMFIANRRWQCRCILYERVGDRSDLPQLPDVKAWPLLARAPSRWRMHTWVTRTIGTTSRDPLLVTTAEIDQLASMVEQWQSKPWWAPIHRIHWSAFTIRLSLILRRRTS